MHIFNLISLKLKREVLSQKNVLTIWSQESFWNEPTSFCIEEEMDVCNIRWRQHESAQCDKLGLKQLPLNGLFPRNYFTALYWQVATFACFIVIYVTEL